MNEMNDPKLNDELADFTDRLLAGETGNVSAENQQLADVVRQLHTVIAPQQSLSPAFKAQLDMTIRNELKRSSRTTNIQQFQRQRLFQRTAVAAIFLAIASGILFVVGNPNTSGSAGAETNGQGNSDLVLIFGGVIALLAVGLLVNYLRNRRK